MSRMRLPLIVGLAILLTAGGCAYLRTVDARIEGRVLLEGVSNGQLAGTEVILDGWRSVVTEADGTFSFTGEITGADEFEIEINRPGYYSWFIEGTLAYDISNDDVNVTKIAAVTLPKVGTGN